MKEIKENTTNNMTNNKYLIFVAVFLAGLCLIGGTYALLVVTMTTTNDNYITDTHCFQIEYTINEVDNTQEMTGLLVPARNINKGIKGRVGLKTTNACDIDGLGTLRLHLNSTTSSDLTVPAGSYCEDRSTLEPLEEYTTEAACTAVGQRWRNYGDGYCENDDTLVRLTSYETESDCTTNGGTWTTGGSPLKYAVYDVDDWTETPVAVGKINANNIGHDINLVTDLPVNKTQNYYYIYIWLDGYLSNSTYTDLPFDGYISAVVIQDDDDSDV